MFGDSTTAVVWSRWRPVAWIGSTEWLPTGRDFDESKPFPGRFCMGTAD